MNYIHRLEKHGTNSTHFTSCCNVAITDRELRCPRCNELIIGWDEETDYLRGMIRWSFATRHWRT